MIKFRSHKQIIGQFVFVICALLLSLPTLAQTAEEPIIRIFQPETGQSRGYQTTPQELTMIAERATNGEAIYIEAIEDILDQAERGWNYGIDRVQRCGNAESPGWIVNQEGVPRLFARALAFHLTGDVEYAEEAKAILERIMGENFQISMRSTQCRLNFSWGMPEIISSADLIESYWINDTCTGYGGVNFDDETLVTGNCKEVFQNWLARNPYYIISYTAEESQSNWGAAATNTLAHIADYLWDRPDLELIHRYPPEINEGEEVIFSPQEAYTYANQLALDRMNGYRTDYHSSSACDFMSGNQQGANGPAIKSQISSLGIIPDEARRQEFCNISRYDGSYQNYPQLHLGNNIAQCELMFRRGDSSCYDNIETEGISDYEFIGADGETKTTQLLAGRGSIERGINAIIIDSDTEWRHDSALEVAYRYYYYTNRRNMIDLWLPEFDQPAGCDQDMCFGTVTHGFPQSDDPVPIFVLQTD